MEEILTRFVENLVGLVLDAVYQFITVKWFYPGEALVTTVLLALVPYLLLRGPFNRLSPARKES